MLTKLLIVLALSGVTAAALLWFLAGRWAERTDEASERLDVVEGEIVDTGEMPLVLSEPDPLTDELWTFAKREEPERIFYELAWARAWDFETELEMAA